MRTPSQRSPPRRKWLKRLVFSLVPAVVLFGGLELALRLAGFEFRPWYLEQDLFVPDGPEHLRTNPQFIDPEPYDLVFCFEQRFAREKAAGTYRVAMVGASSVHRLGAAEQLIACLARGLNREVEFLNFGFTAAGSERVLRSTREALGYDLDLLLVYCGHNEFISVTNPATLVDNDAEAVQAPSLPDIRIIQLLAKQRLRYAPPSQEMLEGLERQFRPEEKPAFYHQFRRNLEGIIGAARSRRVPVVLATVPFSYQEELIPHAGGLMPAHEKLAEMPIAHLRELAQNDPQNAYLEMALADHAFRAGELSEAKRLVDAALEHAPRPVRATPTINRILDEVARKNRIPLADVQGAIAAAAGSPGLPGRDLFSDRCHLNARGNAILMQTYCDVIIHMLEQD